MGERNDLRDEFRQQEREFNAYLNERRQAARARQEEERGKRHGEYEQRQKEREVEKLNEQPHVTEIMLIEQTIAFCKSLTATKAKEEKKDTKDVSLDNPEGTVVLGKKEDRDEFWFAPTKEKKTGKKAKGKESGGSKPIKHNAETFRLFYQLKLDAPITVDDIPGTLEKLEAQLEMYQEKVKVWETKREEMKEAILAGKPIEEDKKEEKGGEEKEEKEEEKEEEEKKEEAEEEAEEAKEEENEDDKEEEKEDDQEEEK